MFNLLTSPSARRTVRGLFGTVSDAVRSVVNPAALVEAKATEPAPAAPVEAPDPAGLYTEAEMPPLADIGRAALGYNLAVDAARSADRAKRKHRKLLDRLPAGTYGSWIVRRVPATRQTVDLEAVRRIFAQHGLGDVPMRDTAPSLRVERAETESTVPAHAAAIAA